jgi:DNA-binding transcriptional regulator GbsR (MarR family)
MNPLSYYHLREEPWAETEDATLRSEYVDQKLDIIQIADRHYKTPGQISYRLKKLGITDNYYKETRGYDAYLQSDLYCEIKESPKKEKQQDPIERPKRMSKALMMQSYTDLQLEVNQLRSEIKGIKNDVKEILRLMTAVYDFETHE